MPGVQRNRLKVGLTLSSRGLSQKLTGSFLKLWRQKKIADSAWILYSVIWNIKKVKLDETGEVLNHLNASDMSLKSHRISYGVSTKKNNLLSRCTEGNLEGTCMDAEQCFLLGGQVGRACDDHRVCCTSVQSCGEASSLSFSYFQSSTYPQESSGSLACDYDIFIQPQTCAVRIDFESASLAGKLGGTCDIDQLYILNSIDGPTSGLCGQLSGYSTTVAVNPSQVKPLKLAFLIQNEIQYHWYIKITQLPCEAVTSYQVSEFCGRVFSDPRENDFYNQNPSSSNSVWWRMAEPAINTYYYAATKKQMQQNRIRSGHMKYNIRRIINGMETRPGEFPWVVAIGLNGLFFCGGALINNLFVLTAAHCLLMRDTPTELLIVHIGDYDLTMENETQHVVRKVKQVIFHSHFHPFLLANDIALLRLNKPVQYNIFIQPICLPSTGKNLTWDVATTVGWGFTSFPEGKPSPMLQKLQVETISNVECARLIEEHVSPGMICAASQPLQGTCFGDSGGPLTVTSVEGVNTVIGLVSFGISGCAMLPDLPDLYTRVSEYLPWIRINMLM